MTSVPVLRVFVSSPSDVRPERLIVEQAIARLKQEYAYHLSLEAVLWEREPLTATHHFQDIENIPQPRSCDIVLVILWSRLGVRLPPDRFRGALTGGEVTGTEWEFEDALAGYRENGLPDLLFYRKKARVLADLDDDAALAEAHRQKREVEGFLKRWFVDSQAQSFTAAFHEFTEARMFEELVETHLRGLIKRRLEQTPAAQGAAGGALPPAIRYAGAPFRGLLSFEPEHVGVFFGRGRAKHELRELVARQAVRGPVFVLVLGASGSGKSSLVKAGLLPELKLPGMVGRVALCRHAIVRPSDGDGDPLRGLAASVLGPSALPEIQAMPWTAAELGGLLADAPEKAATVVRQGLAAAREAAGLTVHGEARLALVVDQLEELFTQQQLTADDRRRYVRALEVLAGSGQVWVIATMRGDFFDRLGTVPGLAELSQDGRYLLTLPSEAEIGLMVSGPAREAGCRYEVGQEGIALDEIIRQAAGKDPGALPLLSFLLDQLWHNRRSDGTLTRSAYDALGGMEGALGMRAEEVFQTLPPAVQESLPKVLRALVTVGQGEQAQATARTVVLDQFTTGTPQRQLIEAFLASGARLLVADGDAAGARIRVAHEAILTHWVRAREQIEHDRVDLQLRSRLEEMASRWNAATAKDRERRLLRDEVDLSAAQELVQRRREEFDAAVLRFVDASAADAAVRRRRSTRRLQAVAAVLALLAVGAGIGAWFGYTGRLEAELQTEEAERQARVAETERGKAEASAVEARRQSEAANRSARAAADSAREAERQRLIAEQQKNEAEARKRDAELQRRAADESRIVAETHQARLLANLSRQETANGDPAVGARLALLALPADPSKPDRPIVPEARNALLRAVDSMRETVVLRGHSNPVRVGVFAPDGKRVLTGSVDRTVRLWDADTGYQVARLTGHEDVISAAAFSPDGKRAVTVGDKSPRVWNTETGHLIGKLDGHTKPVTSVAYDGDGRHIVTGAWDNTTRVWDAATLRQVHALKAPDLAEERIRTSDAVLGAVMTSNWRIFGGMGLLAVSPDGQLVASAGKHDPDAAVRLWDLATGRAVRPLLGTKFGLGWQYHAVVFSPDGTKVAGASSDGLAYVWDVATGKLLFVLRGHTDDVSALAFSADGKLIVTASHDRTARLWNAASGEQIAQLLGHEDRVVAVAVSPDGAWIATASDDGTARLWRADKGTHQATLRGHRDHVTHLTFSRDGSRLLTTGRDGSARIWKVRTTEAQGTLFEPKDELSRSSVSDWRFELADSGERLLAWKPFGNVTNLVEAGTGRIIKALEGVGGSFAPGGASLLLHDARTSVGGQATYLVAAGDGRTLARLDGSSAAFTPDGKLLVERFGDRLRLIESSTGRVGATLRGHRTEIAAAVIGSDGARLLSASSDTVRLWATASGAGVAELRGHALPLLHVSFDRDGVRVLTLDSERVARAWQATDGRLLATMRGDASPLVRAAIAPSGRHVVGLTQEGGLHAWEVDSGAPIEVPPAALSARARFDSSDSPILRLDGVKDRLNDFSFDQSRAAVTPARWSRDKKHASDGWFSGAADRILLRSGNIVRFADREAVLVPVPGVRRLTAPVLDLLAGGGRALMRRPASLFDEDETGSEASLRVIDLSDGHNVATLTTAEGTLRGHVTADDGGVVALLSPAGTIEAFALQDGKALWRSTAKASHIGTLWDGGEPRAPGLERASAKGANPVADALYAVRGDGVVDVLDLATGRRIVALHTAIDPVRGIERVGDGQRALVRGDKAARLVDLGSGAVVTTFYDGKDSHHVQVSPDRQWAAVYAQSGPEIQLFDARSGRVVGTTQVEKRATEDSFESVQIEFVADIDRMISISPTGVARLHALPDGRVLATLESGEGSKRKKRASSSDANVPGNAYTTEPKDAAADDPGDDPDWAPAFSGLSRSRAVAGAVRRIAQLDGAGRAVVLWDAERGKPVATLDGHGDRIVGMRFLLKGERIVTVDARGVMRLWNARDGALVATPAARAGVTRHAGLARMIEDDGGALVVTADKEGEVLAWRAADGSTVASVPESGRPVSALHVGRDGKRIVAASAGGPVRIISGESGALVATLQSDARADWLSIGDEAIALLGADGKITVASLATGATMKTLLGPPPLLDRGDSDDFRDTLLLAEREGIVRLYGADGATYLWSVATGARLASLRDEAPHVDVDSIAAALSLDAGSRLLLQAGQTMRLVDAQSGRTIAADAGPRFGVDVAAMIAAADRVVLMRSNGSLRLYDAARGELIAELTPATKGKSRSWSLGDEDKARVWLDRGGNRLLSLSGGTLVLWDARSGRRLKTLSSSGGRIIAAGLDPEGRVAAALGEDGSLHTWRAGDGNLAARMAGAGTAQAAASGPAFSKVTYLGDGSKLMAAGGEMSLDRLKVWDVAEQKLLLSSDVLGGDPRYLLWKDHVVDATSGQILASVEGMAERDGLGSLNEPDKRFDGVIAERTGRFLASTATDDTVRLWDAASGAPGPVLKGHEDAVVQMMFSADGRLLVSCARDASARVWDVATGAQLAAVDGHVEPVVEVALSEDSRVMASRSLDGRLILSRVETGERIALLELGSGARLIGFNPDSSRLVTFADREVRLWDAATGAPAGSIKASLDFDWHGETDSVVFASSGAWVVLRTDWAEEAKGRVFDARSGKPHPGLAGMSKDLLPMFSPNGRLVAGATGKRAAGVWNLATGELLHELAGHDADLSFVEFAGNDRVLTASKNGRVRLWDMATGRAVATLPSLSDGFSTFPDRDGRRLLAVNAGSGVGLLVDPADGRVVAELKVEGVAQSGVDFTSDGRFVVTSGADHAFRFWDAATGKLVATSAKQRVSLDRPGERFLVATPSGPRLVLAKYNHELIDVATGRSLAELDPEVERSIDDIWETGRRKITTVAFAETADIVAAGIGDGSVRTWARSTGQALALVRRAHRGKVEQLGMLPDGKRVLSRGADGVVRLWMAEDGKPLGALRHGDAGASYMAIDPGGQRALTIGRSKDGQRTAEVWLWNLESMERIASLGGHEWALVDALFVPDGRRILTVAKGRGRLWDAATGAFQHLLWGDHTQEIAAVAVDREGRRTAFASADKTVSLWSLEPASLVGVLRGHDGAVNSVAFSPDGSALATGSEDGTARIWDANNGLALRSLIGHAAGVNHVAFRADGGQLATASKDGTVRLWSMTPENWTKPPTLADLVEYAQVAAPVVLSSAQRRRFDLPDPPAAQPVSIDGLPAGDACDLLAADPTDVDRHGNGVPAARVATATAVAQCGKAAEADPATVADVPRYLYQLARALTLSGDHESAEKAYRRSADLGYRRAMASMGYLLNARRGEHDTASNRAQAKVWLERAADKGDPDAKAELGFRLWYGLGQRADAQSGYRLLTEAARLGSLVGLYRSAQLLIDGDLGRKDFVEAQRRFLVAARVARDQGDGDKERDSRHMAQALAYLIGGEETVKNAGWAEQWRPRVAGK